MIICKNCGESVLPIKKRFPTKGFLVCFITGIILSFIIIGVPLLVYALLLLFEETYIKRAEFCPVCNKPTYFKVENRVVSTEPKKFDLESGQYK